MKILVAEDDEPTRQMYHCMFKHYGCEVDLVQNGLEAVELIKKQGQLYTLCVMDIEMPVMGGLDAIRLIRQYTKNLSIIAVSSAPEYKVLSLAAGADDFFCKPIASDQLLVLTRNHRARYS